MSSVLLSLIFSEGRNIAIETIGIQRPYLSGQAAFRPLIEAVSKELEVVVEMVKSGVQENASTAMSQHEYQQRYDSLVDRYDILKAQFDS